MRLEGHVKKCKSGFPKKFTEFTTTGTDCYPTYRRRRTGETLRIRRSQLDNRWVVPYNPYLLALFDCHINVEICSSIKAVKYLYKYVYKGHDRVCFSVVEGMEDTPVDEINRYQAGRSVSPPEAAWRIFGFDLFEIHPPVMPLTVHTENMQYVRFVDNEELQEVVHREKNSKTPLTEFFTLNAQRLTGPKYLYSECPDHFVWDTKSRSWRDRKRGFLVGRVATVMPGDGERYYLRLLLTNVRGPKSFKDLLIVDGYECATFQESALKRGLLESDETIERCMDETIEIQMPHALRRLFATIFCFCTPSDPKKFWEKYYDEMSEDYKHQYSRDTRKVLQLTSQKVEQYLEGTGKTFAVFKLTDLHDLQDEAIAAAHEALEAPVPLECMRASKQLNAEQKVAYKAIIHRVKANQQGAFFVDGPGGTGKTFLYCAIYAKIRAMGKICLPTASSGIAASNMPTGRTAHSRFKIPPDEEGSIACTISKQSSLATLLQQTIIWDEASMAKKDNIEALDLLLRDICDSHIPFGGKIVVFGGDFRQVLPVLARKTQQDVVEASLVSSYIWPQLEKFRLTRNIRAMEDPAFSAFLLCLGNGELQTHGDGNVRLPVNLLMRCPPGTTNIMTLSKSIFPELEQYHFTPDIFTKRAILTPKNCDVDKINALLIEKFPGAAHVYESFDTVADDTHTLYPIEFLNALCPGGMSPHKLTLKEDCPVLLLRNLDPAAGLCNGTRLI